MARADDPSPAEQAADEPLVPLVDVASLTIPEDEVAFDTGMLGLPIVRVEVRLTGHRWITKPTIQSVKFGEPLSPEAARRAMRELSSTGSFVRLAAEAERAGSGVLLRIIAVPSRTVAAVQIDGGVLERAGTLRAAGIATGEEISEREVDDIPAKVAAYYDAHGFPQAKTSVQVTALDDPLELLIVITIDPKQPRLVTQRIFVIEPYYDKYVGDLKSDYDVKAGDRLDTEALYEADRQLSQALREATFYKARVSHRTKFVGAYSYLYVYVDSGPMLVPVYEGNRAFDADQLTDAMELERGQIGSSDELVSKLLKHYRGHGFLDVEVTGTRRQGEDLGIEHVVFDILEHARVEVERRVFVCLPKDIDPDDVGSEINGVLEAELPNHTFISLPNPRLIDTTLSTRGQTGARPGPLDLSPASTYTPEGYSSALKRVRDVYLSKGYLNAVIGPVTVVRAACAASSPADGCIEEPVPVERAACKTSDAGLPLPEPPAARELTCEPNPAKGIRCSPRITLRIPMHLGPVTSLWDLSFDGNAHATAKTLGEVAKLELGSPLSLQALEDAKTRLIDYYQDRGYAYAAVRAEVELSPDRSRARVKFQLTERDLVFIEDIDIEGALRTDHGLIRRRVAFKKGDVYSKTKIRQSQERLATLGTFSSVSVTLADPDTVARKKRIIVRVSEYASQYIEPKVGFSTGEGLRFGFEYGNRNIASLAISLTLRIQLSYLFDFMIVDSDVEENLQPLAASQRLERRNSVRVNFPEIGLGPLVSFGLEAIDLRDNQRDFGLSREAFVPSITYRPVREVVASLSASAELNDVQIFGGRSVDEAIKGNRELERLLRFPDGTTFAVAQRVGVTWDRRDTPFAATSGTLVIVDIEHVNAFPADPDDPKTDPLTSHFMKMSGRFSGYVRLSDSGVALAVSVAMGGNAQLESESRTYPDRLFYMGGFDSLRSFLAESLVPQDVADEVEAGELEIGDVAVRGGDFSFNPRVELRVPITGTFAIGVFVDAGNLWVKPSNFNPVRLRYGIGAGLRITTPIGPLAFDYGFNPEPRQADPLNLEEDIGALHFSIGLF